MSDNMRRAVSVLLLVCLCAVFAALPVCAAEVTRPAVTTSENGTLIIPDGNEPDDRGHTGEDLRKDGNDGTPTNDMPQDDAPTDRLPGEYNADENGAVAGVTDEPAWSNWIVWGIVIALLVAAAIVAGVVFLVPSKDED